MESLRNNCNLVVVVNTTLMNNHQRELADALQNRKVLRTCTCDDLLVLLQRIFDSGDRAIDSTTLSHTGAHTKFMASCIKGSFMLKDVRISQAPNVQQVAFCFRDGRAHLLCKSLEGKKTWHTTIFVDGSLSERMNKPYTLLTLGPGEYIKGCEIYTTNITLVTNTGRKVQSVESIKEEQACILFAEEWHMIVGIEYSGETGKFHLLQETMPPINAFDALSDLDPASFRTIVDSTVKFPYNTDHFASKRDRFGNENWLEFAIGFAILGVVLNMIHNQWVC
jgi:hypothetical protein